MMRFPKALGEGTPPVEWDRRSWMEENHPQKKKIDEEARKIQSTVAAIAGQADQLRNSPFIRGGSPLHKAGVADVASLQSILKTAVPVTDANRGLYVHMELAGKFGRHIAFDANWISNMDLDPNALDAAGNLHDVGKLTGIFRYHFHDLVGAHLLRKMRIRTEIDECLQPARFNIGPNTLHGSKRPSPSEASRRMRGYIAHIQKSLSSHQQALILADICGKAHAPEFTTIHTWEDMEAKHMKTRQSPEEYEVYIQEKALWPSEIHAYNHMPGFAEGWLKIYRYLRDRWRNQGADVDEIRKKLQQQE
jgi:hypothetical protein